MPHAVHKIASSASSANEDMLRHLAFDNSVEANIISTVSTGKLVMANAAACALLGYSQTELLTKSRANIFDITETSFKKMLKQRTAEGSSKALITAIKKKGTRLPCQITSAVFLDDRGIKKSITTIHQVSQDISGLQGIPTSAEMTSASMLAENKEWIKYIAKTSYDVMWDWNVQTGKIYVGNSIEEIFGYKVQNNTVYIKHFKKCLDSVEVKKIEKRLFKILGSVRKNWKDSFQFARMDGSIATTRCRANIIRDENGKAIRLIGAMQDISNLEELQQKLDQQIRDQAVSGNEKPHSGYKESLKLIFNSSTDVLFDIDLNTDEVMISDAYEKEFGYSLSGNMTMAHDWLQHIHPDDKAIVQKDYLKMLASTKTKWKCRYRFLRADNSIANVESTRIILRDAQGKAYRMIGNMHETSKNTGPDSTLSKTITLKEIQIADTLEEAKNAVRSDIGRELHDNVNQLLGASSLYIGMAKKGGRDSQLYLERSSEYTASAIEAIRKLSKGLTTDTIKEIGLCESIQNIVRDTMEVHPAKITVSIKNFDELGVSDKFKLALFRIVQEQLNNIIKHAKAAKVAITIEQNNKQITLNVSDDGIGFDTKKNAQVLV